MKFEFDHKSGMMMPKKDENIYFGRALSGGLRIDDRKNNITYILERDGSLKRIFGVIPNNNMNIYDDRNAHIIADRVLRVFGREHKFADFKMFSRSYHKNINESRLGKILDNNFNDEVRKEDGIKVKLEDGKIFYFKSDESYFTDLLFNKLTRFEVGKDKESLYEFEDKDGNYVSFIYTEDEEEGFHEYVMESAHSMNEEKFNKSVNACFCADIFSTDMEIGEVEFEEGYKSNRIIFDGDTEYVIYDSYNDAYTAAYEQQKDRVEEDMDTMFEKGSGGKNESQYERFIRILGDSWLDYDGLEKWYREDQEEYFNNIDDNEFIDNLKAYGIVKETEEFFDVDEDGDIDTDSPKFDPNDYFEKIVNKRVSEFGYGSDMIDNLTLNFGGDYVSGLIKDNKFINVGKLVEKIIDNDGIAETISQYDGKEIAADYNDNTYYIYRLQ